MEENVDESMKHLCKFCNKGFPCGRSLGGHMRSHLINSTDHDHQVKRKSCSDVGDKVCKECGKGFQSWKALFGHMKCHSMKVSTNKNKKIASLNQDSWISNSDDENSDAKNDPVKRSRSRNRQNKRYTASISMNVNYQISSNNGSTSMASEIEQEEEAEVAMSLMMLSRDLGKCSNSSVLVNLSKVEGEDLVRNGFTMNKFEEIDVGFDFLGRSVVGLTKISKFDSDFCELKDSNKSKFECLTCNKSFHSQKATLCGHKASHQKVLKRDFDPIIQSEDKIKHKPVLDHDQTINGYDPRTSNDHQESSSFNLDVSSLKKKTKVLKAHECPICFKVFTSGQALGGHKRSHMISEAKLNQESNNIVINKSTGLVHETRGFLDLNMLPEEEEDDDEMNMSSSTTECKAYCWEDSSDHHSNESRILCLLSTS